VRASARSNARKGAFGCAQRRFWMRAKALLDALLDALFAKRMGRILKRMLKPGLFYGGKRKSGFSEKSGLS
jgi:hypothetical protein